MTPTLESEIAQATKRYVQEEWHLDTTTFGRTRERAWARLAGRILDRPGSTMSVIPEGAGTVNPTTKIVPGVGWRSLCTGGQPSARRRGQRWSARSATRTNDLGVVKG
jgi:hypothetical protein